MSEKRFKIVHLNLKRLDMCDIQDTAQEIPTFYNDLGHISSVEPVCELLNKLNDENEQLREINKEIGDDLYNCRLNKNIISEKLKLWQDTLAEYDIYTIKDFKELMKNE